MPDDIITPNPVASDTPSTPPSTAPMPPSEPSIQPPHKSKKLLWLGLGLLVVIGMAAAFWLLGRHSAQPIKSAQTTNSTTTIKSVATPSTVQGQQLDTTKNYGNKYASGLLPVGDHKYTTDSPKQGYIYACTQYAQSLSTSQGGAGARGPWFSTDGSEYNINAKAHVQGSVNWTTTLSDSLSGSNRLITSNDLPDHPTGIFPISATDPAYAYDRNPNHISSQSLSFNLPLNPTYGSPNCMGGQVGIMLTGVALFNGFDAGGRDAGAWEVQDQCSGHPEKTGEYHYHTLSSCISNTSVSTVIGFALDGFPITGPKLGTNNILTTTDLDVCHGIVSSINLDNKTVTMYHYVMTQDFPYSVSCFRAKPISTGPPGQSGPPSGQPHP